MSTRKRLSDQGIMVRYQDENEKADLLSKLSKEELEQLSNEVYVQQVHFPTFEKPAPITQAYGD